MSKVYAREELDRMGCMTPGCNHDGHGELFLKGRCHPQSPTLVSYERGSSILRVVCSVCRKPVADVLVGEKGIPF